MKAKEIINLTKEEIEIKLREERNNYNKLVLSHKISPIENPIQIRNSRKLIARLNTVLNQKGKE